MCKQLYFNGHVIIFDKEAILAAARKERIQETPQEVIKDPMRLEFLTLKRSHITTIIFSYKPS